MRAVIQRVSQASVSVDDSIVGQIGHGYVVLLWVTHEDDEVVAKKLVEKIIKLRLFADDEKPINRSILDVNWEILLISQFTLYADTHTGNRPSFLNSAKADHANDLYAKCIEMLTEGLGKPIQTGEFGAKMDVMLVNDGPVTITLDTQDM